MRGVIALLVWLCVIAQVHSHPGYRAAVIDYSPIFVTGYVNRTEAIDIMNTNLDHYESHLRIAQDQQVQISLFPEDGLYGSSFYSRDQILPYLEYIPDVDPRTVYALPAIVPCSFTSEEKDRSPILTRASCLAQRYNLTLVLNMGEIRVCEAASDPRCPSDDRYQYNTLVAFSSNGQVRYYHENIGRVVF